MSTISSAPGRHADAGLRERLAQRKAVAAAMTFPFFFALVLPLVFIGLLHSPTPRDMDVAVAGYTPQATAVIQQLDTRFADQVDARRIESGSDGERAVREGDARAAYDPTSHTLYVAGSTSLPAKSAVTKIVTAAAGDEGAKVHVVDVAPVAADDPSGSSTLYLGMGAIVGGMLTGLLCALLGGGLPTGLLLGIMGVMSVVVSGIEVAYGWGIFDVFDGHAVAAGAMLAAIGLVVSLVTWGGTKAFGPVQLVLTMGLLVFLGATGSGLPMALDMAPQAYSWVHAVIPTSRGLAALRELIYLPDASIVSDVLVMAVWAAGGLALGLIAQARGVDKAAALLGDATVEEAVAVGAAAAAA